VRDVPQHKAVCQKTFIKRVNLSMLMTKETMCGNPEGKEKQGTGAS